jgi:DNA-binding IclR family transcriptional regulator
MGLYDVAMTIETQVPGKVEAVERALTILTVFKPEEGDVSLAELARRTSFHKSTILRLIGTLQAFGFIERDATTNGYRIGLGAWRIGQLFNGQLHLEARLRPLLVILARETEENASFFVPDLGPVPARICLMREESIHSLRHIVKVGDRLPFDQGASGRLLRAYLRPKPGDEVLLTQGFCLTYGDRSPDLGAVAAPVMRNAREIAGVLTVSAPTSRHDRSWFEQWTPRVIALAAEASAVIQQIVPISGPAATDEG